MTNENARTAALRQAAANLQEYDRFMAGKSPGLFMLTSDPERALKLLNAASRSGTYLFWLKAAYLLAVDYENMGPPESWVSYYNRVPYAAEKHGDWQVLYGQLGWDYSWGDDRWYDPHEAVVETNDTLLEMTVEGDDVLEFQGQYRWLSNFWPAQVLLDGVAYPSVENAYQAAKFPPHLRFRFTWYKPGEAKKAGEDASKSDHWTKRKVDVMQHLIQQKFAPGTEFARRLVCIRGQIIEGNRHGDAFWGVCGGAGENTLGKMIMAQRDYLLSLSSSCQPRRLVE